MSKVTFIVRSAKGRIRNVSPRPRLGQDQFRDALDELLWGGDFDEKQEAELERKGRQKTSRD